MAAEIFDLTGVLVASSKKSENLNIASLSKGKFI